MNIPWYGWLLIIAGALIVFYLFITIVLPLLFAGILVVLGWIRGRVYAREARIHNEKARQIRLQRDNYEGYPLPMTREPGEIRITKFDIIHNPNRVSGLALERAYDTRAKDLWIELETMKEIETGDTIIRWKPRKDKKPKERY